MIYKRHYIQFNDLVFGEYSLLSEGDYDVSFKGSSTAYGNNRHGSYTSMKSGLVLESGQVALTLTLDMKKILCSQRPYYRRFVLYQLNSPGKLWAVQDGMLVWAYAKLKGYGEYVGSRKDQLEIDLNFELPEGVWHKADKQKTFVLPYNICDFIDCFRFKDIDPCKGYGRDCCDCSSTELHDALADECCDCSCDEVSAEYALCFFNDYQSFYACRLGYRVIYNCEAGEKFFDVGQKLRSDTDTIASKVYADTDIDTDQYSIVLKGKMVNPYVEVNGNGNWIEGEFDGELVINSDGSVYYNGCLLDVDAWQVPTGMDYGWVFKPGYNKFIAQSNSCCNGFTAYLDIGLLTY